MNKKASYLLLTIFLFLQTLLIFPVWKLPYWRLQKVFEATWQGYFWPWIPYSLYDQPVPKEGSRKIKYELWIKPTYLPPRVLEADNFGKRVGRFQLNAIITRLLFYIRTAQPVDSFVSYLETITGLRIESCWIDAYQWTFENKIWVRKFHDQKYSLR